jgi:ribonuclease HII
MTREQIEALTIAEVESLLSERSKVGPKLCSLLESDRRSGVRRLAVQARKVRRRQQAERARLRRMVEHEQRWWQSGLTRVAGVDEVGRGCLAGPVVAAAVVLPTQLSIDGIDDSKKLDREMRESLCAQIEQQALGIALSSISAGRIDEINILEASMEAMRHALAHLDPSPQQVLVDGNRTPGSPYPEMAIVGGDARSISIAAASIVAKVHRDRLMVGHHDAYPEYGFRSNKGYASREHMAALDVHGPCPLHRKSFSPVTRPRHDDEQLHLELGSRGEALAADYLKAKGYRILERRYRAAGGEIDLVAEKEGCVAFVEVKTSQSSILDYNPEERVAARKKSHLVRASRIYMRDRQTQGGAYRFDVIAVGLQGEAAPQIHHLEAAFEAPPF